MHTLKRILKVAAIGTLIYAVVIAIGAIGYSGYRGVIFYFFLSFQGFVPLLVFTSIYFFFKEKVYSGIGGRLKKSLAASTSCIFISLVMYWILVVSKQTIFSSKDLMSFSLVCILVGICILTIDLNLDRILGLFKKS